VLDNVSCASVAEQLKASGGSASSGDAASLTTASVPATSHQSEGSSAVQAQSLQSAGRHPGLSEAAFKRAVGETPLSADDLEKVQLPHAQ